MFSIEEGLLTIRLNPHLVLAVFGEVDRASEAKLLLVDRVHKFLFLRIYSKALLPTIEAYLFSPFLRYENFKEFKHEFVVVVLLFIFKHERAKHGKNLRPLT